MSTCRRSRSAIATYINLELPVIELENSATWQRGEWAAAQVHVRLLDLGGEQATARILLHQPAEAEFRSSRISLHAGMTFVFLSRLSLIPHTPPRSSASANHHHAAQETITKPGGSLNDSRLCQETKYRKQEQSQGQCQTTTK